MHLSFASERLSLHEDGINCYECRSFVDVSRACRAHGVSGKRIPGNGCIIQSDSTRKVHSNSDEVKWKRLKRNFKRIFKAERILTVTVDTTHKLISVLLPLLLLPSLLS